MLGVVDEVERVADTGLVQRLTHHRNRLRRRRGVVVAPGEVRLGAHGVEVAVRGVVRVADETRPVDRRRRGHPLGERPSQRQRQPAAHAETDRADGATASRVIAVGVGEHRLGVADDVRRSDRAHQVLSSVHVLVAQRELPVRATAVVEVRQHHVVARPTRAATPCRAAPAGRWAHPSGTARPDADRRVRGGTGTSASCRPVW